MQSTTFKYMDEYNKLQISLSQAGKQWKTLFSFTDEANKSKGSNPPNLYLNYITILPLLSSSYIH